MIKKRQYKLLTKTSSYYLVFTFLAFLISIIYLNSEAEEFIQRQMDKTYNRVEHRVGHKIKHYKKNRPNDPIPHVIALTNKDDIDKYPTYLDTLVFNDDTGKDVLYKRKRTVVEVDGEYYLIEIFKEIESYYNFKDDINNTLIPAFIILLAVIVLFNIFLSRWMLQPFNKILVFMNLYKPGKHNNKEVIATNTREFNQMQELFAKMTDRIDTDYNKLKEYTEDMAHEIQTPLSIIRNKTELLLSDENVMQNHSKDVKIIYDESNHLSKLGNTLNLLTKIENGEFQSSEALITKPVIENHIEKIKELLLLKNILLEKSLSESHTIKTDLYLFDIVMQNLLRNAIRYGSDEGPIRIITNNKSLIISNYGKALLSPDKIFDRFHKNGKSNKALGLGLSLVKKICEINSLSVIYYYKENQHFFEIISKS